MLENLKIKSDFDLFTTIVIASIIIGLGATIFFLWIDTDSYSSLYIVPDSVVHDSYNNSVYYSYGVTSFESRTMNYSLNVYFDNTLLKTKYFALKKGETLDERGMVTLPVNITYPSKISLVLTTANAQEEVHFWLSS